MLYASVDDSFGSARQLENPLLDANNTEQLCAANAPPKSALTTRHCKSKLARNAMVVDSKQQSPQSPRFYFLEYKL